MMKKRDFSFVDFRWKFLTKFRPNIENLPKLIVLTVKVIIMSRYDR